MYKVTKLLQNRLLVGIVVSLIFGVLIVPGMVGAEETKDPLGITSYGKDTGLGTKDIRATVASIINVALGLLGIIAVVIVLAGGFKWMTAGGNEEKTTEARKLIFAGIIGLAIILSSYAIAQFVIKQLWKATSDTSAEYPV